MSKKVGESICNCNYLQCSHLANYPSFQEGNWIWVRTRENINYTAWEPNEPNDNLNQEDEDCLHMIFDGIIRYKWNDYPCNNSELRGTDMKPLCQKRFA